MERGLEVELEIVTPEPRPLAIFGTAPSAAVATLLGARGIRFTGGASVEEDAEGYLIHPGGGRLEAGALVALPVMTGPGIPGLPADDDGFIPIDQHAAVVGAADLFAAGDATTFPIKQGGLGTQQADAAAEMIASRAGARVDPQPFRPVLRGKLITGEESLHLRGVAAGGGGEGSASADYLWWPPQKVAGRYLAPYLAGETPVGDLEPPARSLDIEVAWPTEWHSQPMALDPF
jgi:sulfide:quinone oxidoreductase